MGVGDNPSEPLTLVEPSANASEEMGLGSPPKLMVRVPWGVNEAQAPSQGTSSGK